MSEGRCKFEDSSCSLASSTTFPGDSTLPGLVDESGGMLASPVQVVEVVAVMALEFAVVVVDEVRV